MLSTNSLLDIIENDLTWKISELNVSLQRLNRSRVILDSYLKEEKLHEVITETDNAKTSVPMDSAANTTVNEMDKLNKILSLAKDIRAASKKTTKDGQKSDKTVSTDKLEKHKINKLKSSTELAHVTEAINVDASSQLSNNCKILPRKLNPKCLYLTKVPAQLRYFGQFRPPAYVFNVFIKREQYCEQAKLYSKLLQRSSQPKSIVYDMLANSVEECDEQHYHIFTYGNTVSDHKFNSTLRDTNVYATVLVRLLRSFRDLIVRYTKYSRMHSPCSIDNTFHVSQLSSTDKVELVTLWYKGRKLLQLYEHFIKTKRKILCSCEYCAVKYNMKNLHHSQATFTSSSSKNFQNLLNMPIYTPLSSPSCNVSSISDVTNNNRRSLFDFQPSGPDTMNNTSKSNILPNSGSKTGHNFNNKTTSTIRNKTVLNSAGYDGTASHVKVASTALCWEQNSQEYVKQFHEVYQSRVKLAIESSVGQHQLKGAIKALKGCCEVSAASSTVIRSTSNREQNFQTDTIINQWVDALKQYKAVYSILLKESHDFNECMFLKK